MNNGILEILRDTIVTGFQFWCLTLAMENEKYKNKISRDIFLIFMTTVVVILSYCGVSVLTKFSIAVFLVVLVGRYIYECPRHRLFLYAFIMVLTEYCSEIVVIQVWNWYNAPVYTQNMMYEDFVFTVVLMACAIYFILMCFWGKIVKWNRSKIELKEVYTIVISGIPFLVVLTALHMSLPFIHETSIRWWFLVSSIGIFCVFVFNVIYMQ